MSIYTITTENFETEVTSSEKPVLIDFWASWCGPCRMLAPIVEEIAAERSDLKVGKVNVDESPEIASTYDIMSIPTLILFDKGVALARIVGVHPKEDIIKMIDEV